MIQLNNKLRLAVTGDASHGKDTTCEFLRDIYGLRFVSSSYFVMDTAVIPYLAEKGITYPDREACYADRVNHRVDWYKAIRKFNEGDEARLSKKLFETNDIYCGLRSIEELTEIKRIGLINASIWVDRSKYVKEETGSTTIRKSDCDYVLDNNNNLGLTKEFLKLIVKNIDDNCIPF